MTATLANGGDPKERRDSDFYPTPPECTHALLDWLKLSRGVVLEPACGDGAISKVIEARGLQVVSSDIRETGYGIGLRNFLEFPAATREELPVDWIITNPPFSLAEEFIRKALSITPNVAMLLKSQYWHANGRAKLFGEHPPAAVLPLTWRPDFLNGERGGAPTMEVAWTVWREMWPRSSARTSTIYQPLQRPNGNLGLI